MNILKFPIAKDKQIEKLPLSEAMANLLGVRGLNLVLDAVDLIRNTGDHERSLRVYELAKKIHIELGGQI